MRHQKNDHDRLRAWLAEDTGSEAEAERLLPVVERLRGLSRLAINPAKKAELTRLLVLRHRQSGVKPFDALSISRRRPQRRVVCIEDDQAMIDLVTAMLRARGFEVLGSTNGVAGLELIPSVRPDLVLLDLMMPDMDGWAVYQHMQADEYMRTVPVIVVTAKAANVDRVLGLGLAKVQDYITKPFSPIELLKSINRVLGESNAAWGY